MFQLLDQKQFLNILAILKELCPFLPTGPALIECSQFNIKLTWIHNIIHLNTLKGRVSRKL